MNRIRGGAASLRLPLVIALLAVAGAAYAQETTGRVIGRVTDKDSGAPLAGVTVIVQGPQGEDATITDDQGNYQFTSLPLGTYTHPVLRRQRVDAGRADRASSWRPRRRCAPTRRSRARCRRRRSRPTSSPARCPRSTSAARASPPQFDENYTRNVPTGRNYGDVIQRAPGAFIDATGNVSIAGSTGLENIYIINGLNVTGMDMGNLESGAGEPGRRHQPAHRVHDTRSTSTAAATRPNTAARWAASSTRCSSRAATSSTAACSACGRRTG